MSLVMDSKELTAATDVRPDWTDRVGLSDLAPGPAANRGLALLAEADRLLGEAVACLAVAEATDLAAIRGFRSGARMIAYETRRSNRDAANIHTVVRLSLIHI